jgi:hypothetical protein
VRFILLDNESDRIYGHSQREKVWKILLKYSAITSQNSPEMSYSTSEPVNNMLLSWIILASKK